MKRILCLVLTCIFLATVSPSEAQFYYYNDKYYESAVSVEAGISAGIMNSLTDLGGKKGVGKDFIKDLNWKNANMGFGGYVVALYKYAIGARLEASFGTIEGADSVLKPVTASTYGRYERNLSFKSRISEIQLVVEVHPLFFRSYDDDNMPPPVSPYLLGGIGYFSFDPQAKINGRWMSLQPLRTEGQGFSEYPGRHPYKLHQFNVPLGLGVKYEINSFINARLELVHRILFTDYLDDVSKDYINPDLFANYLTPTFAAMAQQLFDRQQELDASHITQVGGQRGDPRDNDAFFSIQLKIGVIIGRKRR
jgi:hypothetical protein